jgi:aspartyl-tRNA(Asn)/glutamyl-tRNA(Gln) amidotransferase subunit A
MFEFSKLTIQEARKLLDTKEIGTVELAKYYLKNIEENNKDLNVYLEVYDDVLKQAEEAQKIIDKGESKSLTGIPLAIKDNILIKGRKAGSASKILENYTATYNATVSQKLLDEGAVFLGRTNMDEFACGGSTENSAYGPTKNPIDPTRVPGGSSGGSSASVVGDLALGSLGSDTGGSIREPASFCGLVGLKPTYGSVSRYGLMAMGSSLDIIGPLTKTVTDAEIIFDAIKGKDKMDSTSIDTELRPACRRGRVSSNELRKIGIPRHLLEMEGISEDVLKNFEESLKKLKGLGYEIKDIELPNIDKSLAVYYIIMPAEVSSNVARYDGIKYGLSLDGQNLLEVYKKTRGVGFGKEIRRRIILGTYVLSSGYYDSYYGKAMIARRKIREEFENAYKEVDAILTPTTTSPAFKIGEISDPLEMYLADIFTVSANIVGCPAISIPSGFSKVDGIDLPLGIQFMAPHLREDILFDIGKKFLAE